QERGRHVGDRRLGQLQEARGHHLRDGRRENDQRRAAVLQGRCDPARLSAAVMRLLRDTTFQVAYFPFQLRPPEVALTIVAKATFDLVPGGECVLSDTQPSCS